ASGTIRTAGEIGLPLNISAVHERYALENEEVFMSVAVKIVMIEDDEGHARLIEKNIRRAGVTNEIVGFADGTSALEYLFSAEELKKPPAPHPMLILLDLNLPDMSGVDILKRVKEDEHMRRAPVVVLTTTDDKGEIQ